MTNNNLNFGKIFDSFSRLSLDGIWIVDTWGRILEVNEAYGKMSGYSREELLTMSIKDLEAQETPQEIEQTIARVKAEGVARFERTHRRKDGVIIPVEISVSFFELDQDQFFLAFIREFTLLKIVQKETAFNTALLRLSAQKTSLQEFLDAVVEHIRDWCGCEAVGLGLAQEPADTIKFIAFAGSGDGFAGCGVLGESDPDQCLCFRLLHGKPELEEVQRLTAEGSFYCNNLPQFISRLPARQQTKYRAACLLMNMISVAIVPLRYHESLLGVILLAGDKEGQVPLSAVEFLESMAPLVAEGIARHSMEAELERNLRKQGVINGLLNLSLEDLPLDEILECSLELLTDIPFIALESKGSISLVEDDPDVLIRRAQKGLPEPVLQSCAQIPFGRCICGRAAASRKVQFYGGYSAAHEISFPGISPHGHYCIPIMHGARVLGVLNLYVKAGHHRSASEENFLVVVAQTLAGIIMRREAEAGRRRSDQEFSLLVGNVPAIVFKADMHGFVDFVDVKVEEMVGYPKEEFDQRRLKWTDLILSEDVPQATAIFLRALRGAKSYVREYRIRCKTGAIIWIQERSQIIRDAQGKVSSISGVLFDISKRKQGEEAVRESEARFRSVVESATDAIITADIHGNIISWNKSAQTIFGYAAEEVMGQPVMILIPERYREAHRHGLERFRDAADFCYVGRTIELIGLRRDGGEFPLELSLSAWRIAQGTFFTAMIRDITDRHQAAEALRQEKETAQRYLDIAPVIFAVFDRVGKITLINKKGCEILGYPEEEVVGRNFADFLPAALKAEQLPLFQGWMAGELEPVDSYEASTFSKTGEERIISWGSATLRNQAGEITGGLAAGEDITERRRAEKALQESFAHLQRTLEGTVTALATAVETRDPYTAGHQRGVAQLACAIAAELGFSQDRLEGMRVMGFLHDVGKIAVPAEILSKPGRLSEYEFNIVKFHSQVSYDILKEVDFPWPVALAVLQHHEKIDGSGYPHGLVGKDIILEARILTVADVVEAMASHRPYRPALGTDKAIEEISQQRGVLYDPAIVDACLTVLREKRVEF